MVAVIRPAATGTGARDTTCKTMLTNLSGSWQPGNRTTTRNAKGRANGNANGSTRRYRPMSVSGAIPARLAMRLG